MGRKNYKQIDEKPVFRHYYITTGLKHNIDFLTKVMEISNTEFMIRAYEYYRRNPYIETSTIRKGEGYMVKDWMWQVYILPSIIKYAKAVAAEYKCTYSKVIYQMLFNYAQVCNQIIGIDIGEFYGSKQPENDK